MWIMTHADLCLSPPSACHSLSFSPSLLSSLTLSFPLFSLYHSVSVTVTMRAFGAPRRHSHVAAADMRMWPWLAAPWRATREHFKGCLTAGWEILCSPRGPRTSGFRHKLYVQTPHTRALEQGHEISCTVEPQVRCAADKIPWHMRTHDTRQHSALWSWPHVEENSVSYTVSVP